MISQRARYRFLNFFLHDLHDGSPTAVFESFQSKSLWSIYIEKINKYGGQNKGKSYNKQRKVQRTNTSKETYRLFLKNANIVDKHNQSV